MSSLSSRLLVKISLFFTALALRFVDILGSIIFHFIYAYRQKKCLPEIKNPILLLSASQVIDGYKQKKFTSLQVVQTYIERQKQINPILNSIVFDRYDLAIQEAKKVDERIKAAFLEDEQNESPKAEAVEQLWKDQPFFGVPITVKEAFAMKGCPNCSGLVTRQHLRADEDAAVVARLRSAGAIPLSVTNVSEVCMWWESSNKVYGRSCNPYDPRRIVGGSSGGEAATIAAAGSVCGIGSDIGGSIRMPAHFNGIYGHKATTCSLPNEGQFPMATNKALAFMLPGPLCRYANDMRSMLKIMADKEMVQTMQLQHKITDIRDIEFFYMEDLGDTVFTTPVEHDIRLTLRRIVQRLRTEGCSVQKLTSFKRMRNAFLFWSAKMSTSDTVSFSDLLADGHPDGFQPGKRVWDWITGRSTHTLPALGLSVVERITGAQMEGNLRLCEECDILRDQFVQLLTHHTGANGRGTPTYRVFLIPTHPTSAPYHTQPLFRILNFAYTGLFNVLGLPVTAVPMGLDSRGMPISVQVVGNMHEDFVCLSVAEIFEKLFGGWIQPDTQLQ